MNREEFKAEMVALVRELIPTISDDGRATDDPSDDTPGMQLTIGADADGWSYQTGDNSYSGGAYGYSDWAVTYLSRDSDPARIADEIIRELDDCEAAIFDDDPGYCEAGTRVTVRPHASEPGKGLTYPAFADATLLEAARIGGWDVVEVRAADGAEHSVYSFSLDRAPEPQFDGERAEREGWGIFDCDGSDNGPWQIQKIDASDLLENDMHAWQLVAREARAGSAYHRSAIEFIREHNPTEYESFCKFTGWQS